MQMRLSALMQSAGLGSAPAGSADRNISGVADDSRRVAPGNLFVALQGTGVDARRFIPEAVRRGAAAVVVDDPAGVADLAGDATVVVVGDGRRALACLAHAWFGHPARDMVVAGVTGTNGKTTVAHFLESILQAAGLRPGLMGTIEYRFGEARQRALTTTPSSLAVAEWCDRVLREGGRSLAIEVSSHGLEQRRVDGFAFSAAIITNLTQDHLDYHHTMEEYGAAKRRFFYGRATGETPRVAVFNLDDPFAAQMALEYGDRMVTYGFAEGAQVRPTRLVMDARGSDLVAETPHGPLSARVRLPGRFNVLNALAAIAATTELDIPLDTVRAGVEALDAVAGRFERIVCGQPFEVIVDYAHTPDALSVVLTEARRLCAGRLTVLFGCGGERDAEKRPLMGAIAGRLCDGVIITNDNPRSEDPEAIAAAIVDGVARSGGLPDRNWQVELDRREAMRLACRQARPGDMIVFAGRGHEPEQIVGAERHPFDDRAVAREALAEMGYHGTRQTP